MIGSGFGEQADKDVFLIGPTGLALGEDGALYVSDALGNRIAAIPDAATRSDSAGTGRDVTKDGLLKRPLAMTMAPNGHLLVTNGLNGQVVEIDPETGKPDRRTLGRRQQGAIATGQRRSVRLVMTPSGDGFYYVEDEVNTLVLAH